MARVGLLTGPTRSRRAAEIDALAAQTWGTSLLIVPTRHEATDRAARIITAYGLPGAWDNTVLSFEDFALALLNTEGIFPQIVDEFERRLVMESVLARLKDTECFRALGTAVESAGFVSHVLRVITRLKQAAVEPRAFRDGLTRRKRPSWLDAIVADVYEAYQEELLRLGAYDRVGAYWQADVVLTQSRPALFARVRHVYFDGFDDFTPSEFRLVRSVEPHVDSLVFGIACDMETPSTSDLFAIPRRTAAQIRQTFPALTEEPCPQPPPATTLEFVATNLFWRTRPVAPPNVPANLSCSPCHDPQHECESIARTVKRLIVERGVAPDSIAIVHRRLDDTAARLRAVLAEFEIPATFRTGPRLSESPVSIFLMSLFEALEAWDRDTMLDIITTPSFAIAAQVPQEHIDVFGLLACHASIIEGKQEWTESLLRMEEWLCNGSGERHQSLLRKTPDAIAATASLRTCVALLQSIADLFPKEGTRAEYAAAIEQTLARFGESHDVDAIATTHEVLWKLAAWDARLQSRAQIDRAAFKTEFQRALSGESCAEPHGIPGVQVLDAESVRGRSFSHVFLCGLNDGVFPSPPASDAIYTDEDLADLEQAGVPIEQRSRQLEREMLLLHHVLSSATHQMYISWSTVSPDGRSIHPSAFVEDILDLTENRSTTLNPQPFIPDIEDAASPRDLRNASAFGHRNVEQAFPDELNAVRDGARIELERASRAPFGRYDGVLSDAALLSELAAHYGPDHVFSVAQLETYARCPFQFFLQRILRLEMVETPDAEFDPRTRGRIMHDALQRFHEQFIGQPLHTIPQDDADAAMTRIVATVFDDLSRREFTSPRGVCALERARLTEQLLRYLQLARDAPSDWEPSYFEVGFGGSYAKTGGLSKAEPFRLQTGEGPVLLSGRIDRIDRDGDRSRVIDYKTSIVANASDLEEGLDLQLPVYAVALEEYLLPGTECAEARLIQPGRTTTLEALQRKKDKWPDRRLAMLTGVARSVRGIRSGQFPPTPHDARCRICASCRVCRYEQWRVDLKNGQPNAADA